MQMWVYIIRRIALLIPIIIGVMTITFALISALPVQQRFIAAHGDPPSHAPYLYNQYLLPGQGSCPGAPNTQNCPNPVYNQYLSQLGLNKPVPQQWAVYMYRALTFQWGTASNTSYAATVFSNIRGEPVTTVLGWFLPYTIELAFLALAIILAIAIPFGNLAAVNRNRPIDQAARVVSFSGYAAPAFLLGALVLTLATVGFGAHTGYFGTSPWCSRGEGTYFEFSGSWPQPTCYGNSIGPSWLSFNVVSHPTGFPTVDALIHHQWWLALDTVIRMLLPAMVIAFGLVAVLLRFVRNSMLEVMNLDFVRTARAEGIPEKTVVKRHAGRNSLNVTITVLGLTFAFFIGGFPVIEDVFKLNGVGLLLADSVNQATAPIDFGIVFGSTLLFTYIVVVANIVVDVLYAYLDPRVRLG